MVTLGWFLVMMGLATGLFLALIPGVPGVVFAWFGLVALRLCAGAEAVPDDALLLGALVTVAGFVGQLLTAVVGVRTVSSAPGPATGAALGPAFAWFAPTTAGAIVVGALGSFAGAIVGPGRFLARVSSTLGWVVGVGLSVMVDLLAVFGVGAVVGVLSFVAPA